MAMDFARKIAALLRKAEAKGTTPEERLAYQEKAERLMIKWGVDEAVARREMGHDASTSERIIELRQWLRGTYHQAEFELGASCARGLGNLRVLRGRANHATMIYIVGFESDVKRWESLFASLRLQAAGACEEWVRAERKAGRWSDEYWERWNPSLYSMTTGQIHHEKFKARRQFIRSYGHVVERRLREMRLETVATTTGAELALRDSSTLVDEWISNKYGELRPGRGGIQFNARGSHEGRSAGERARLGQNEVRNERKGLE